MEWLDSLFKKKIYRGEVISLKESYRTNEKTSFDGVATVYYNIYQNVNNHKVGSIELRLTVEGNNYYYGHIGYHIFEQYRHNHYAYEACKEVFKIAKDEFSLKELIITCSPDNIASYKTLEKLNGELIETVDVPKGHHLYTVGETKKCIFKFNL